MKHTITIIRHGMTEGNITKTYTGITDVPLCEMGVDGIKAKLGQYPECDLLFVSDLQRTHQTARIIYPDMEQIIIPDIHECDMGDFTGKCYEQLKDTPEYQRFLDVNDGFIPNGECKEVFHARCLRGFDEIVKIIEEKGAKKPAIVSHGGVIMALMNNFTDEMTVFFDYQTTNGGGYVVEFDTETRKFEILETLK
ncbi:MAG: histidine phosphatase family protein [Clostridia bacterium]|nr:histidine phosphatase family protein [Clostridia bacterium]